MSTRTFSMGKVAVLGAIALLSVLVVSSLASAAVAPTVTGDIRNNSTNAVITTADVGTQVYARVEVASTSATTSPTGTVDFSWYAGTSCSGSATTTHTNVPLSSGIATSNTIQVPVGGLSFKAHYDGQADIYNEADSNCIAVAANQINQNNTALSLSLSDNNVNAGDFVSATPSLTGESNDADGSIAYKVWNDNSCTNLALDAGSKTVTDGSTPNSDSWQFITPGTYYWQGVYSGDANNEAATSSCTGAVLTVVATSTGTTTPPATGENTISGTVFNDLDEDDVQNGSEPGLSGWTVWLHKQSTSDNIWKKFKKHDFYDDPIVAIATTDGNGNYSFGDLAAGTYFVEEDEQSGWTQNSDDKKVVLSATHTSADVDFANVQKGNNNDGDTNDNDDEANDDNTDGHHHNNDATSTDDERDNQHGNKGHDKGDNSDDNGTTTSNGDNTNRWGGFKFDVKAWANVWKNR